MRLSKKVIQQFPLDESKTIDLYKRVLRRDNMYTGHAVYGQRYSYTIVGTVWNNGDSRLSSSTAGGWTEGYILHENIKYFPDTKNRQTDTGRRVYQDYEMPSFRIRVPCFGVTR